jgi:hypothetical protein
MTIFLPEILLASNFLVTPIPKYSTLSEHLEISGFRRFIHFAMIGLKIVSTKDFKSKIIVTIAMMTVLPMKHRICHLLHCGSAILFVLLSYHKSGKHILAYLFAVFSFLQFIIILYKLAKKNRTILAYRCLVLLSYYVELILFAMCSLQHK